MDKVRLLCRKDKESYLRFYHILGFYPHDIELYKLALLHRSSSIRSEKGGLLNNERLEYLGDAVLELVTSDVIYRKFEGKREGFMTSLRSKMVSRESLNQIADKIGLSQLVQFTTIQSAHNCFINGNALEAFIGAIYLDRGYKYCQYFIEKRIISAYMNLDKLSRKEMNFKSKLLEWSQKNKMELTFELISQSLDEFNSPIFESAILIEGIQVGQGKAYSKKQSHQEAAHQAWNKIKKGNTFIEEILAAKSKRESLEGESLATREDTPIKEFSSVTDEKYNKSDDREKIIREAEEAAFNEME